MDKNAPKRQVNTRQASTTKLYAFAMFQYLKVSPSYDLANKFEKGEISKEQRASEILGLYANSNEEPRTDKQHQELMVQFQKVVQTRKEFGDLKGLAFKDWWERNGARIFDMEHELPRVRLVSKLIKGAVPDANEFVAQLMHYLAYERKNENSPEALLVSIPMGIPKKELLTYLDVLIDRHQLPITPKTEQSKIRFAGKRLRINPLFLSLRALAVYAAAPDDFPLWKTGLIANVSPKNCEGLDPMMTRRTKTTEDQLNTIAILMHRHVKHAQLLAENAAHGEFPSKLNRPLPILDRQLIDEAFETTGSLE
jgi:hypothetical protein